MTNPSIDAILKAAAGDPKWCKCGHRKTSHGEIGDRPCDLTACGCTIFRGTSKVFLEASKESLYDLLVSVASENKVWAERLAEHEHCASRALVADQEYDRRHKLHDDEIRHLNAIIKRGEEANDIIADAQEAKLVVFHQLIHMAVDSGRIPAPLFDAMERGLQLQEDEAKSSLDRLFLGDDDDEMHSKIHAMIKDAADKLRGAMGGVKVMWSPTDDPNDPDAVDLSSLVMDVSLSPSSEAQIVKDAADKPQPGNDWADDDDPEAPWNQ